MHVSMIDMHVVITSAAVTRLPDRSFPSVHGFNCSIQSAQSGWAHDFQLCSFSSILPVDVCTSSGSHVFIMKQRTVCILRLTGCLGLSLGRKADMQLTV